MVRDNQGVTFIELIVVLIIIGILAGGAFIGIRSIDSGNAQSSVKRIDALLNYVRVQNMSRDKEYYLVLEEADREYIAKVQYRADLDANRTDVLNEKLELKNGNITYYSAPDSSSLETAYRIASDTVPAVAMEISFNKETGALQAGDDGNYIRRIVISAAGRTYTINLVKATGKHYIE